MDQVSAYQVAEAFDDLAYAVKKYREAPKGYGEGAPREEGRLREAFIAFAKLVQQVTVEASNP